VSRRRGPILEPQKVQRPVEDEAQDFLTEWWAVLEALLKEAALSHREVMSDPAPIVLFKNLGESGLDFELYCYVDVDARGATRSELLFDIFKRLNDARIEIPYPTRRLEISSAPGESFSLGGIVREK
jgi:small-conductance mechanosensitive channel